MLKNSIYTHLHASNTGGFPKARWFCVGGVLKLLVSSFPLFQLRQLDEQGLEGRGKYLEVGGICSREAETMA